MDTKHKVLWLVARSVAFGGAIWVVHFLTMLAYGMRMIISESLTALLFSIFLSSTLSFLGFYLMSSIKGLIRKPLLSSLFLTMSIYSVSFICEQSMEMNPLFLHAPFFAGGSLFLFMTATFLSVQFFRRYAHGESKKQQVWLSALLLGGVIAGVNFSRMSAMNFLSTGNLLPLNGKLEMSQNALFVMIGLGIFTFISLMVAVANFEKKMKTTQSTSALENKIYRSIVETANDAVITADRNGRILSWNKAAEATFGFREAEILKQPLSLIFSSPILENHLTDMETADQLDGTWKTPTMELEGIHKNGDTIPVELSLSSVNNDSEIYFTAIIRDITERLKDKKRIEHLVFKDTLTNLPNRRMVQDHITSLIKHSVDNNDGIAVMFMDLDRFKHINDVYGHQAGDQLLTDMAKRSESCLDDGDMIARLAGDEFLIVLPSSTPSEANQKAENIIQKVTAPFQISDSEIYISCSIGISMFPEDAKDTSELIQHADTAMYTAKEQGGTQVCFYTDEINQVISRKVLLESGLRTAIERNEMDIFYQPQVLTKDNRIVGFEALLRWKHPKLGMISPVEFIPLAEETKLIGPIGEWTIETACRQYAHWLSKGYEVEQLSLNISAVQFLQRGFPTTLWSILKKTGLSPDKIVLEITESVVQDTSLCLPIMKELKEMGFKLSLDDFGTGYSSLQYLKELPLDIMKIDKSFIQSVPFSDKDKAIVETIINMASLLDLKVVAEGVETVEQLSYLKEKKSTVYQGYLYSPPLSHEQISAKFFAKQEINLNTS
ncbi:EAL domain-containing protein [Halobacillus yeomjeoni]|uniref:bifunctional diguanylate cyclase/phosphodiesterase n=1 Tax=Halobacillus yeomjeoni TaxID=311194 RepID=UPI001CD6D31F|nr:EAL domain-containing protein [Halobacillus yeomjeoni]MCA0983476.1 EAL domain-containing protein [Halobacillus yeomjeoni]